MTGKISISLMLAIFWYASIPLLNALLSRNVASRNNNYNSWRSYDKLTGITTTVLFEKQMKRPILDQIASTLFRLENDRVESSSVLDDKGRYGEPMEWSDDQSFANIFSRFVSDNPIGYQFKQWVADITAGNNYDPVETQLYIKSFISEHDIAMFSFTTCPFCRKAKDTLDERGLEYSVIELDELLDNRGNEIRAELGKLTKRTSVPSIFVQQQYIGGCNDGPGLLPLLENGDLFRILNRTDK
jgi:glutaredoxin 3